MRGTYSIYFMFSKSVRIVSVELLKALPARLEASDEELVEAIEINKWFGRGIDYVDVHLLEAA